MPYLPYLLLLVFGCAAVWLVRLRRNDVVANVIFIVFAICAVWFLSVHSSGRGSPFGDFNKAYYPAGRLAITEPARLYDCAHADGLCFVNIPIVALVFAPVSTLSLPTAHAVVTMMSVAAVAAVAWGLILLTGSTGWRRYAIVAAVLMNGPLFYSIRLGNLTHVVLVLLVAAVMALVSRHDIRAGILLGLCALVKPPLLIWLPYFVVRGRWRAASGMAVSLVIVLLASVAWFGLDLHRIWFDQFIAGSNANAVGAYNVQSINGFLVRLTTSGTLLNWQPVDVGTGFRFAQVTLALLVLSAALLSGLVVRVPRERTGWLREYSVVLCVMLALSPITWTHYYCFLLIPLAAYVADGIDIPHTPWWTALVATVGVLVSLPVMLWVPAHPFYGAVIARILLSHYVFGCGLLLAVLLAAAVQERRSMASEVAYERPAFVTVRS